MLMKNNKSGKNCMNNKPKYILIVFIVLMLSLGLTAYVHSSTILEYPAAVMTNLTLGNCIVGDIGESVCFNNGTIIYTGR